MESTDLTLRFDGPIHSIDANLLIANLIHTTHILNEINSKLDPDKKITINVKAPGKGSFLIHLELFETVANSANTIFSANNVGYLANFITVIGGIYTLHKFFSSDKNVEKIDGPDTVKLINITGNVTIDKSVYNIYYNNPGIQDSLSSQFESLRADSSIQSFELIDKFEKKIFEADQGEFSMMANEPVILETNDSKSIIKEVVVNIIRPSFDESLKWDLIYNSNKISAKVKDPNFYKRIDNGEAFSKGDSLLVELQINQIYDDSIGVFVNKSYVVNSIKEHYPKGQQSNIKFPEQ
jgi:hypothetical protein